MLADLAFLGDGPLAVNIVGTIELETEDVGNFLQCSYLFLGNMISPYNFL